jgi:hypothetical protein
MPGAAGERTRETLVLRNVRLKCRYQTHRWMPAWAQFLGRLGTVLLGSSQPACLVVAEKFRTKTVTNAYR